MTTKNYLSQRLRLSIYFLVVTIVRMSFCVHGRLGVSIGHGRLGVSMGHGRLGVSMGHGRLGVSKSSRGLSRPLVPCD
jgi:hypothetical protein